MMERVAGGFTSSEDVSEEEFKTMWKAQEPLFEPSSNERVARTRALIKGIRKVGPSLKLQRCKIRLVLLFLSHEVELLAESLEPPFRTGQKRITTALERIAKDCEVEEVLLKNWYKRKRAYLKLAEMGGLGSLLQTDASCREYVAVFL